ncbi:hypothetical protein [Motiliproteus sediminis]|uniref:hypothetical protein n=1 Tax=Motiliproteus sediminis TaxID=1468178 RepID=UPI001AF00997|nr:hypothetical protein [Motiliproteus sediminis]
MTLPIDDLGTITTLLDRFNTWRLPRLLAIKERVDSGERLSDEDLATLDRMIKDARSIHPLADKHPEYQGFYAKVSALYKAIVDQATANSLTLQNKTMARGKITAMQGSDRSKASARSDTLTDR